jgi:cell division protease FtsH
MPKVSGHTSELIDKEVRRLLDEAHDRAEVILADNRELLNRLSALLIATEVIDGDELKAYVEGMKEIPDPSRMLRPAMPEAAAASAAAQSAPGAAPVKLPPAPRMPVVE